MKRLLAVLLVASLATTVYVVTASGGSEAVTPRQFRALSAKVTKLQKQVKTLNHLVIDCIRAASVSQYGGYVVQFQSGAQGQSTALDFTEEGDTVDLFLAQLNAECVSSGMRAGFRPASASMRASLKPQR